MYFILYDFSVVCCQESYVKEVSEHKVNMLLVNKADLLTREQRRAWARHFQKEGLRAVFWSALAESDRLDAEEKVRRWRFEKLYSNHHPQVLMYVLIHLFTSLGSRCIPSSTFNGCE